MAFFRGVPVSEPLPSANPYSPPQARSLEPASTPDHLLAERGTRLGAALLDGLFYLLAYLPGFLLITASADNLRLVYMGGGVMLLGLVGLGVWNLVWLGRYGQSLGKRVMRIRIVHRDGRRMGLARIFFLRGVPMALLGAIPLVGPILSLVDSLMIFGEERRCLHDQFADSIVVKA